MDKFIKQLLDNGYKMHEVYEADLNYLMYLQVKKGEPKQEKSLIGAFGG